MKEQEKNKQGKRGALSPADEAMFVAIPHALWFSGTGQRLSRACHSPIILLLLTATIPLQRRFDRDFIQVPQHLAGLDCSATNWETLMRPKN